MTPPLEAMLHYAFEESQTKLRLVVDYLNQSASRRGVPDPEDEAQRLALSLFGSPAKTRAFFEKLADRNPALASTLASTPANTVPLLTPAVSEQVGGQVAAYVARALRNAAVNAHHRNRTVPLPEDDSLQDDTGLESPSDLGPVRLLVLTAVESDEEIEDMTRPLEEQILADLGLARETVLTPVAHAALPPSTVAHGLSGDLAPPHAYSETFEDLPLSGTSGPLPFRLTRHSLEPALLRIENAPAPCALRGAAESTPQGVLLDGRAGSEGGCAFHTPEGLFVVTLGVAGVTLSLLPLTAAPPKAPLAIDFDRPPPTLSTLLDGASCASWLSEHAGRRAASPARSPKQRSEPASATRGVGL